MVRVAEMIPASRPAEGGHWYTRDGAPCYEIRSKAGTMRPVTLRDARGLALVPSVSTIAAMESKPALIKWQIEQALMSALTLPRQSGESDDAFIERARTDSQEQARKAADRGTRLHAVLQGYFEGSPVAAEDLPYVTPVVAWIKQRYGTPQLSWEPERSFAHGLGYGGKCDLLNRSIPAVADFKCKDFGEDKQAKDLAYPEHCSQLAAYAEGFGLRGYHCVNIFVSTRIPGLIRCREWDNDELAAGWEVFRCLLRAWQLRKGYNSAFSRVAA